MKFRRFFPLLWSNRRSVLRGLDLWAGLVGAAAVAYLTPDHGFETIVTSINVAELGVSAALVGVVLAGLAILFAFMTPEFTRAARKAIGDLSRLYFPFWFVSGLAVATVTLNMVGIASNESVARIPPRALLFISTWLFFWAVFGTFFLVPYVAALGAIRGSMDDDPGSGGPQGS